MKSRDFRIPPDSRVRLSKHRTKVRSPFASKEEARSALAAGVEEMSDLQTRLYAGNTWSLLLIFQAMDAAGKDSTIKHVMSGLNPQGVQVHSFKVPSDEDLDHDFLWRTYRCLPPRGRIGVFNRSYYEEVLVVRVHAGLLDRQRLPERPDRLKTLWEERYEDINAMERHLARSGTVIRKFFLHVSPGEQKKRFLERLEEPRKHWKFSAKDVEERAFWFDYMEAYERMLSATSTSWAPWYVIPADDQWFSRFLVGRIIVETLRGLNLEYPVLTPQAETALRAARRKLLAGDHLPKGRKKSG